MEVFNLDLIPGRSNPVIHCSQFDEGRIFRANLFEGSSVYYLSGAETLSIIEKKLDGNMVTLSVTNTGSNYIEFATTEQMTAIAGEQLCELCIEEGGNVIGTLNFMLACEPSPNTGIESESEINNLWTQVDSMVADALATQYDSANVVFDALPDPNHGTPYTVTSQGINTAINNALDMTDTASGAIATFESEYALPLRDLEIEINAMQESGTPTPSSPKLISGFTGANIRVVGLNFWDEITEDGYISGSGTEQSYTNAIRSKNYSPCIPSTQYYPYIPTSVFAGSSVCWYDKNKAFIRRDAEPRFSVTSPANAFYFRLSLYNYKGTYPSYANNVSLNYPATDTAYHAYNTNSTTTAISWQSEAGTVYGGSLDVTSGKLTVTMIGHVFDGTENFISLEGGTVFAYNFGSKVRSSYQQTNSLNTHFTNNTAGNSWANVATDCYLIAGDYYVGVNPNMSLADYKTWLGTQNTNGTPVKAVATLQTPVTYQLTPTQISAIVGTNNIFTDTNGNTSLEYYTKRGEQTVHISEATAKDVINDANFATLTTTSKKVIEAVNEVNLGVGSSVRRYATSWGTTCQTTIGQIQFLVLRGVTPYVVWLASTNDINVANIANNTSMNGTGSITFDNVVFTRLSNNNLKVELPSNNAITIFG